MRLKTNLSRPLHSLATGRENAQPYARKAGESLLAGCVSIIGYPAKAANNRASYFNGAFSNLNKTLGWEYIKTTADHPQATGLLEIYHRQSKAGLQAEAISLWNLIPPLA